MRKKIIILSLILSLIILPGCSSTDIEINDKDIEVRGLTLKISLFSVASDVYYVNV